MTAKKPSHKTLLIGAALFFTIFIAGLIIALYNLRYQSVILPNITAAGITLAGKTPSEAETVLYAKYEELLQSDLKLTLNDLIHSIPLNQVADSGFSRELLYFNAEEAAEKAFAFGHRGNWQQQLNELVQSAFKKQIIDLQETIQIDEITLSEVIKTAFASEVTASKPTDFVINQDSGEIEIKEGLQGTEIDIDQALEAIKEQANVLEFSIIPLKIKASEEPVSIAEAALLIENVNALKTQGEITLTHSAQNGRIYEWRISNEMIIDAVYPKKERGTLKLGVETDKLQILFTEIENTINVEPQDARFQIENGEVIEFNGSQNGISLDKEETAKKIEVFLETNPAQEEQSMTVATQITEPQTKTSDVNDLGITEILGVGTSNWRGSPANRIHNIRNATEKLNGLLIAPGEQVSTTGNVGPLTLAGGYLPEAIIAGDEIKPEIGGGLCQIGTTLFRAAMNAGMSIDERRNHSLVVSYYNDPSNGNPGTDATLYEPILDLKFTNTTDHHILLITEFNEINQELIYTIWGTSDGRNAYYTPPQVLSRTAPGPTLYKETGDLAPGETKCQNAFTGASTTFDYIIEHKDGTTDMQTFTSHYRALPQICLVGKQEEPAEEANVETEELSEATRILLEEQRAIAE